MNLFLYIPQHSASPPGLLKSLIFGLVGTYKRQNSSMDDFRLNITKLYDRLLARGYKKDTLVEVFNDVASKLENKPTSEAKRPSLTTTNNNINVNKQKSAEHQNDNDSRLFFHLPYHPRGVSRRHIQQTYKNICEEPDELGESFREMSTERGGTMRVTKLTVAYSRPTNLRDVLSPSTLQEFEDCTVQQFIPNP